MKVDSDAGLAVLVLVGALVGGLIAAGSAVLVDRRRREDAERDLRRSTFDAFLSAAHACLTHIITIPALQDLASEADASWNPFHSARMGKFVIALAQANLLSGMSDFTRMRVAVDRVRMTWPDSDIAQRVDDLSELLHEHYSVAHKDGSSAKASELASDVRKRLDSLRDEATRQSAA